jgi:hypothetical protein
MFLYIPMETKHEKHGARGDRRRRVTGVSGCGAVGAPPNALEFHCPGRRARVRGPICGQRRRSIYAILAGSAVATISGNPADNLLISLVVSPGRALSARRILLCRLKPGRPAFQVEGASASNQSFNWKLFRLDRMRDARFKSRSFLPRNAARHHRSALIATQLHARGS